MRTSATTLFVLSTLLAPFAVANPEPRPPGPPPPLDFTKLGSTSLTPKQALDADALAVNRVSSALLGPHGPDPPKPSPFTTGKIQIIGDVPGWLGDGSLDGDAVFSNISDSSIASGAGVGYTYCSELPSLFSLYGVLAQYRPIPFIGVSTFTGTPGASSSLSANGPGYAFITPTNQTAAKTHATASSSLGTPYGAESTIWSISCATHQLSATWTLADGAQLPLTFVNWNVDGLVATGNYDAFKAAFPGSSSPLALYYVPTNATFFSNNVPLNPKRVKAARPAHFGRH